MSYYSKEMCVKAMKWFLILAILSGITFSIYALAFSKGGINKVQKPSEKSLVKSIDNAAAEIVVQLDAMLENDYVNLRTTSKKSLSVIATNLVKTGEKCSNCPIHIERPDAGELIPENSLQVTSSVVRFARPMRHDNAIVVDIEVSSNSKVKLIINGEVVLASNISKPISWRNGKLGEGADRKISAIAYGMIPLLPGGANASVISAKHYPIVRLSMLKIVYEPDFKAMSGRTLHFALQVDSKGNVDGVYPPSGVELDREVEKIAKEYKFEPYLVDGWPSAFMVVISKKIE
jgi:hypothetical protein